MALDKTFNAESAEPRLYRAWEEAGCFTAGANAKPEASSFCIMIPPPNVTGVLHMGHAFNNTLQDILIRWHRMRGFDTLWQPGTDHAGIATQMVVERQLAETQQPGRRELGREAFTAKIWEWKEQSGGTIRSQLKRLGASCDWSREAFTMSGAPGAPEGNEGNFHDAVIKVFVDLYNKGYIYRGKRLVNWDPHFETAISDLEVENIETPGYMWHFKYPLAGGASYTYVEKDDEGNIVLEEERNYISIATTRPETMLGDGAVAVHPSDERYAPIVGQLCEIPVGPKEHRRLIPIITDDYPDPDFGSGAVKITGAHDFNDYQVAKRGNIPMYRLMDTKGAMRDDGAPYAEMAKIAMAVAKGERELTEAEADTINLVPDDLRGLDRFEARKRVVEQITSEGLAVTIPNPDYDPDAETDDGRVGNTLPTIPYVENKPIMQPLGDRSRVVIEPMLTDQWFVDTDKIVGPALQAVKDGTVKILPESGEKVYYHWLENIEPWCISRQLWWGHQIPVWYGPHMVEHADKPLSERFVVNPPSGMLTKSSQYDQHCCPTEAEALSWYRSIFDADIRVVDDEKEFKLAMADLNDGKIDWVPIYREEDVLDTWFSSGLWPLGTLGWPDDTPELAKYFPTSTLITGQDILFFWVARMMMMQIAVLDDSKPIKDRIPFDTVYLHGLVRDAKGKKMSKSTGNVIDPLDIIDEYGADALRFSSAAMAALGGVLKLDMERIKGYRNFGTKLWNAVRFAEMNDVYSVGTDAVQKPDANQTLNRWIIGEVAKTREAVDEALAAYRFNDAADVLYKFIWNKVCDWYVEFSKPLFYDGSEDQKAETRATMAWVLDQCLILLHPIMPFITEELWGETTNRSEMLAVTDWPTYQAADLIDENADREINWVINLIEAIRSARGEMHVPAGLKVPLVQVDLDPTGQEAWANNEALILKLARIDSVSKGEAPKGSVSIPVPGGNFALPLADIIDIAEEKTRLEKTLGKLQKEIGGLKGRVNNPKFVASAPEDVVEEARENLSAREAEEEKLLAALERLKEVS